MIPTFVLRRGPPGPSRILSSWKGKVQGSFKNAKKLHEHEMKAESVEGARSHHADQTLEPPSTHTQEQRTAELAA